MTCSRIRLYFNSGVFVYRRESGFAAEYLRICRALLDARIGSDSAGFGLGIKEQMSVGLAVITLKLRWASLPYSHNYCHMFDSAQTDDPNETMLDQLKAARIVHYHGAMWPPHWVPFLAWMRRSDPKVAVWLESLGPMRNESSPAFRIFTLYLGKKRRWQASRYRASCSPY